VLRTFSLPAGQDLERRYGRGEADRLYLIRPDGYVGFRCEAGDADRLARHLQHWLA
jgi:hypothetical protein